MKKIVIIILLIIASNILFAQSMLFDKNESGFDIAIDKNWTPVLGYTFKGGYHVGLKSRYTDVDMIGVEYYHSLGLSKTILGQQKEKPLNIELEEYYENGYSSLGAVLVKSNTLGLKSRLSYIVKLNNFKIIPIAEIGWYYKIDKGEYIVNGDDYAYKNDYLFAAVKCIISHKRLFFYTEYNIPENYFDIGLGFIIPTHSKQNRKDQ